MSLTAIELRQMHNGDYPIEIVDESLWVEPIESQEGRTASAGASVLQAPQGQQTQPIRPNERQYRPMSEKTLKCVIALLIITFCATISGGVAIICTSKP